MTDNFRKPTTRRSIDLEARRVEASPARLVLAADADRRRLERELHEGVQQDLVALAVNLQLAGRMLDADPPAAKALLEEMGRDLQQALDETAQLAQRIYPPLLDAGSLVTALRSAAASAGMRLSVEVAPDASYPPEVALTVYWCCVEVLEHVGAGAPATVTVREEEKAVKFEVVADGSRSDPELDGLRDRVEALGGRLTTRSEPGRGTRVAGSLPLSRRC